MKLEQLKVSIAKMSEAELRDFILENRKAQSRYKETMDIAKATKRATLVPTSGKSKEELLQATLSKIDPEIVKKILKDKGII